MARASRQVTTSPEVITVHVPRAVRKRGGRKTVVAPDGFSGPRPRQPTTDDALPKAIVRAFRWRGLLEIGAHGSIAELASAEGVDPSYIGRVLRLTCLAPDLVEAVLNDTGASELTLQAAARLCRNPFWEKQRLSVNETLVR